MKTNSIINMAKIGCVATLLTLYSCAPTSKDLCGVFLITSEYEQTGNLDFLVVNEDFTYTHYYIQENGVMQCNGTWRNCSDSDIEFKDWMYYGLSEKWFKSFPYDDYPSSKCIMHTTYHKNKYINIPDEMLDFRKLSNQEIKDYGIDKYITFQN